MKLKEYFQGRTGIGVFSSANAKGEVDAAIYSTPHLMDDGTIAFIMRDRLTHSNLQTNPHAAYLFIEDGKHYQGIRLFLRKIQEDNDPELIAAMTRRHLSPEDDRAKGPKFILYFEITRILPLIGSADTGLTP